MALIKSLAIPNIEGLCLLVSHKKIFKVFPHMSICKTSDPWGRAIFDPKGYNVNILGLGPQDKSKYQMSKALAF